MVKVTVAIPLVLVCALATGVQPEISATAKKYLDDALDLIQKGSIKRETDWGKLRKAAYAKASEAKTTADTYPAIREAIAALSDHHSRLFDQNEAKALSAGRLVSAGMECVDDAVVRVMPGGPAATAGLQAGMRIVSLNGQPYDFKKTPVRRIKEPFTVSATVGTGPAKSFSVKPVEHLILRPPSGRLIDGRYGYLDVPTFSGPEKEQLEYAQKIQDLIRDFDRESLRGWVVDLRLNGGGNMWPMLAGLGPLFTPGELGGFLDGSGNRSKWTYMDGKASEDNTVVASAPRPYALKHKGPPIVVLIDQVTASSGEAAAIAFRGQSNTVSLGQPTFGVPTGNMMHKLSDGAVLNLCEVIDMDRTGKTYDTKLSPDIFVETNWNRFNQADDRAIQAAIRWISSRQPR